MATQHESEKDEQTTNQLGFREMAEKKYRDIKEHAETYPYVWASYIVVYGGFSLWFAYRWRKLRKTEDRLRGLQDRLRKLVESQESPTLTTQKVPPPVNISPSSSF